MKIYTRIQGKLAMWQADVTDHLDGIKLVASTLIAQNPRHPPKHGPILALLECVPIEQPKETA